MGVLTFSACAVGLAAAKDPLLAVVAGQTVVEKSSGFVEWAQGFFERLARAKRLKQLDKLIQDMIKTTEESYTVFMGTLDPMNDNLICEALKMGESIECIAHAIYSCEESKVRLRSIFSQTFSHYENEDSEAVEELLEILVDGNYFCTGSLINEFLPKRGFFLAGGSVDSKLDVHDSDWEEVQTFCVQKYMTAIQYKNGVEFFLNNDDGVISWESSETTGRRGGRALLRSAVVATNQGIKFFRHKESSHEAIAASDASGHLFGKLREVVKLLVDEMQCSDAIAWRLVTSKTTKLFEERTQFKEVIVDVFKAASRFRSSLIRQITDLKEAGSEEKRLMGTRKELKQELPRDRNLQEAFAITSNIFETAIRDSADSESGISSFTEEIFGAHLDYIATNLRIVSELVRKAKESDVNEGKDPSRCEFDAVSAALLRGFGTKKLAKGAISDRPKAHYLYQEKEGASDQDSRVALTTPFSNLILYAASNYAEIKEQKQTQSLVVAEESIATWFALRAAMEYNVEEGQFAYETASYEKACDLLNESVAKFLGDIDRRFVAFCNDDLPHEISVSHLRALAKDMEDEFGASPAWLVRELVARLLRIGCRIIEDCSVSSYGQFERSCLTNDGHCVSSGGKGLFFDKRINLKGVQMRIMDDGTVCMFRSGNYEKCSQLCADNKKNPACDCGSAKRYLAEGHFTSMSPAKEDSSVLFLDVTPMPDCFV